MADYRDDPRWKEYGFGRGMFPTVASSEFTTISHEPRYADTLSPKDLAEITKGIDPDSKWDRWATEGVPFYPGTTTRDYDPRTDTTIIDPPTLTIPEVDTFKELSPEERAAAKRAETIEVDPLAGYVFDHTLEAAAPKIDWHGLALKEIADFRGEAPDPFSPMSFEAMMGKNPITAARMAAARKGEVKYIFGKDREPYVLDLKGTWNTREGAALIEKEMREYHTRNQAGWLEASNLAIAKHRSDLAKMIDREDELYGTRYDEIGDPDAIAHRATRIAVKGSGPYDRIWERAADERLPEDAYFEDLISKGLPTETAGSSLGLPLDSSEAAALMDSMGRLSPRDKIPLTLTPDPMGKYSDEEARSTYPSYVPDIVADALESEEGKLLAPMIYKEILKRGEEPSKLGIAEALFPVVPGAVGAAYGLGKGILRRGSEALEKFTGGPAGTVVSDAKLADAMRITGEGDAVRLADGTYRFPVAEHTIPDWVPEILKPYAAKVIRESTGDMDVLTSMGPPGGLRETIPEHVFDDALASAAVRSDAVRTGGPSIFRPGEEVLVDSATGGRILPAAAERRARIELAESLPDHFGLHPDTPGSIDAALDYGTGMMKSSVYRAPIVGSKPIDTYTRPMDHIPYRDPFGEPAMHRDIRTGVETPLMRDDASTLDMHLREAIDAYGRREASGMSSSILGEEALKYGGIGAAGGYIAAPFLGSAIGSAFDSSAPPGYSPITGTFYPTAAEIMAAESAASGITP